MTQNSYSKTEERTSLSQLRDFFVALAKILDKVAKPGTVQQLKSVHQSVQQRGLLLLLGFVHLNQSFPVESPTHQPRWPAPAQNKQLEQDKNFRQEFDIKKRASCLENVLKPSELVLNTIKYCYVIPFVKDPLLLFKKNNRLAHDNSKFVEDAINDYLTTIV